MKDQSTFWELEYESKKRKTRRERFLERMDGLIPWERLEGLIRSYYPKVGRGCRSYELSAMLRIHCVRLFYNPSDRGMEDLFYEEESVRRFVGLRLSGPLPDQTTILNFRHLLEKHQLGEGLMKVINRHLESQGLRLREGTYSLDNNSSEAEGRPQWPESAHPYRGDSMSGSVALFLTRSRTGYSGPLTWELVLFPEPNGCWGRRC